MLWHSSATAAERFKSLFAQQEMDERYLKWSITKMKARWMMDSTGWTDHRSVCSWDMEHSMCIRTKSFTLVQRPSLKTQLKASLFPEMMWASILRGVLENSAILLLQENTYFLSLYFFTCFRDDNTGAWKESCVLMQRRNSRRHPAHSWRCLGPWRCPGGGFLKSVLFISRHKVNAYSVRIHLSNTCFGLFK